MCMTVSVGLAAGPARDEDVARTLLARADEALYIAKRNGRDRAVNWHAGMRAFDGSASGSRLSGQSLSSASTPAPIKTA
jgi:predicted signal transduction protein with EAL and GGDEF domain